MSGLRWDIYRGRVCRQLFNLRAYLFINRRLLDLAAASATALRPSMSRNSNIIDNGDFLALNRHRPAHFGECWSYFMRKRRDFVEPDRKSLCDATICTSRPHSPEIRGFAP
jgi:hypothetical protein